MGVLYRRQLINQHQELLKKGKQLKKDKTCFYKKIYGLMESSDNKEDNKKEEDLHLLHRNWR